MNYCLLKDSYSVLPMYARLLCQNARFSLIPVLNFQFRESHHWLKGAGPSFLKWTESGLLGLGSVGWTMSP